MNNRFFKGIVTVVLVISSISGKLPFTVSAKVIEPTICYTETWTASYYIDDKIDTQYPYLDCKADVYTDGKLVISCWNTHEWDGFTTVKHNLCTNYTTPVQEANTNSDYVAWHNLQITYPKHDNYTLTGEYYCSDFSYHNAEDVIYNMDISYYPNDYSFRERESIFYGYTNGFCAKLDNWYSDYIYISQIGFSNIALPNLEVNKAWSITFTPKVDVVTEYNFHILGQDLKVSPEMFTSSPVAVPQSDDKDTYIQELEKRLADIETKHNKELIIVKKEYATQIETITAEKKSLQSQIETLKTENEELVQNLSTAKSQFETIKSELLTLQQNNQAIERMYKLTIKDPFYHPMDLNNDGVVNTADLLTIYKYMLDPRITVY